MYRVSDRAAAGQRQIRVVDAPTAAGRKPAGAAGCHGRVSYADKRAGQGINNRDAVRLAGSGVAGDNCVSDRMARKRGAGRAGNARSARVVGLGDFEINVGRQFVDVGGSRADTSDWILTNGAGTAVVAWACNKNVSARYRNACRPKHSRDQRGVNGRPRSGVLANRAAVSVGDK